MYITFGLLLLIAANFANAQTGNAAAGKELYVPNCASCHGVPPDSNARKAANSATKISSAINSVNSMQFLRGVFTQGELNDIAAYIGNPNVVVTTNNTLTVTKAGTGSAAGTVTSTPAGISCGSSCSASFAAGSTVTLNAVVSSGASFAGWSGACTGTTTTCNVTMSAAQSVTATFNTAVANATLTVSLAGNGSGSVTSSPAGIDCGRVCTANFAANSPVTLTAAIVSGSTFGGWSGACTGSSAICSVTMDAAKTVTARFDVAAAPNAMLTVSFVGSGRGVVTSRLSGLVCETTCSGSFTGGTTVTLNAAANSGSVFNGWSGPCTGSGSTCTVLMDSAKTVAVDFGVQSTTTPINYTDMWWAGDAENGWGMAITQHQPSNIQFNAFYVYEANGLPTWYVMPGGSWNANFTVFTGALYRPTGAKLDNFITGNIAVGASVGTATLTFKSSSTATFAYTINGVSATKNIERQIFGPPDTAPVLQVGDLWWGGDTQNGWGFTFAQQNRTLFGVWYTYGATCTGTNIGCAATWYVMPGGAWGTTPATANTYTGAIYSTVGSPWLGTVFDKNAVKVTPAGTVTVTFTPDVAGSTTGKSSNATLTYTFTAGPFAGTTQTKQITRQGF
jgi:Divergent InlB B-repeat domain/Cytochrome C oxidase, cbb3-type, subunit III